MMTMSIQKLAKQMKKLNRENNQQPEVVHSLDTICQIKKTATHPFYYFYTEVWKDWTQKK